MIDNPGDRHHSMRAAIASLDSGCCVWCEHAPAAATSYLCATCRTQDVDGLLRKPIRIRVVDSSDAA
ncbi:MAG: hypothetical protein QOE17_1934 [Gaiellales bacterium]|jgi:hypothetical protein|nr:hypothetical protein [Gaiellales bacterium]